MYSKFILSLISFLLCIKTITSLPVYDNDAFLKQEEVNQQVRSFYESIMDEVISYHSEALLYSLSYDDDIKTSLMKINQVQYEKCINNIPQYTGMLLYDKHFETYKKVGSSIEKDIKKNMNQEDIQQSIIHQLKQSMNADDFISNIKLQMKSCQNEVDQSSKMKFMNHHALDYTYHPQEVLPILLLPLEQEIHQFMDDLYNDLKDEMIYRSEDSLQLILNDIYT
ncbi:unnamed protein product [Cunninghamella blakesleeana]